MAYEELSPDEADEALQRALASGKSDLPGQMPMQEIPVPSMVEERTYDAPTSDSVNPADLRNVFAMREQVNQDLNLFPSQIPQVPGELADIALGRPPPLLEMTHYRLMIRMK